MNWGDEQADEHDEPAAVGNAERATIGDGCPICMQTALPADAFALPCTHAFCMDCLQRWLTPNHHTCPTCRATVPDDVTVQLLQGTSMPLIFDLGRRLATTDMEGLSGLTWICSCYRYVKTLSFIHCPHFSQRQAA